MAARRPSTSGTQAEIRGSERAKPAGRRLGATSPDLPIEVQVYLRAGQLRGATRGREPAERLTREALAERRARQLERAFRKLERFAGAHGLAVVRREPAQRMIRLTGSAAALEAAFGTRLHDYDEEDRRYRARSGPLCVDAGVARIVEAVLGFTTRPIAAPALGALAAPAPEGGRAPSAFTTLYEFPTTTRGAGQRIALIQLGGQYYPADTVDAFAAMGIAAPVVVPISTDGAIQSPDPSLDREVALDVQVAGAVAPGATLLLYFAAPGAGGLVDTIGRAIHDAVNRPTIVSISLGASEETWSADALRTLGAAFADAAHLGITVIAASGDMLATCGYGDGQARVAYPASDPYVLACGGTTLRTIAGAAPHEAVWNDGNGNGTGGGVSTLWPLPTYQKAAGVPRHATARKPGRGVPDVAAVADKAIGYRIRCRGGWRVESGTSAGAPLWAGLIALINAQKGRDAGFVHPRLYAAPAAFNDVSEGDNIVETIGYKAARGWDACTGLGTPRGGALLALF